MGETSIEWAHFTFNPWIGCQKVSPGCDHCYAETQNAHRKWNGGTWGPHAPRTRTSEANWKLPLRWAKAARGLQYRPRVFCASLADVFDNQAAEEWRSELWWLTRRTPELDWMFLTKRPENISSMLPDDWFDGYSNVWLGTTCEDQPNADRRGRILRSIPARVRFLSCEPLLGPIKLEVETLQALDLIISGGESGHGARPSHPDWHRSLRDQCATAGVHYHFKQWGEWAPNIGAVDGWAISDNPEISRFDHREWEDGRWSDTFRPMWCDFQDGNYDEDQCVSRIGKKAAGRLLDGVEHNGMPVA